jgi:hypothetical protein
VGVIVNQVIGVGTLTRSTCYAFIDVPLTRGTAGELTDSATDCDAWMLSQGWDFVEADPAGALPNLVVGGASGTKWSIDIDADGVISTTAWP